ncbi:MAG: DUF4407 domain-containing protein [Trichodesmium sp. MAG_R03]|nr:DUF4407 domain-containing protein [Trichodesmium sp. MAG_R03]
MWGGADERIIRKAYSQDSTYIWMGIGIVLITLFGVASGGYALFTVFENYVAACLGGLAFGLSLGYLDRSIISSIRKKEKPNLLERLVSPVISITKLFISAGISMIVATPLQVKIFEQPIEEKLQEIRTQKVAKYREGFEKRSRPELEKLEQEKARYQEEIDRLNKRADAASDNFSQEVDEGNAGIGRARGRGPVAEELKRIEEARKQERDEGVKNAQQEIDNIEKEITSIKLEIDREVGNYDDTVKESTDILSRLNALFSIQKSEPPLFFGMGVVALTGWGITLFFVALDGTTITVRLLSPRTPYDEILEDEEKKNVKFSKEVEEKSFEVDREIAIKEIEVERNRRMQSVYYLLNAEWRQKEMAANNLPEVLKEELDEKLGSKTLSAEDKKNYLLNIVMSGFDTDFSLQEFVKTGKSKKKTRRLNNLSTEASRSLASLKSALISSYHLSKSAYGIAKKVLLSASQGLLDIGRRIKRSRTKTTVLISSFLFLSTFTIVEVFTVSRRYDARYIPYPNNINSPIMLDRNGKPIIDQYAHVLEEEKTLDEFPDILVKTVLVSEDRAFFDHWGVSFRGLARAAFRSILGNSQGGSTITQQTVKKLFIEPYFEDNFDDDSKNWGALRHKASSVRKKIHQIILAIMLEGHHDKEDILEAYLNRIYIGTEHFLDDVDGKPKGSIFGFPEASKIYFSKDIREISVAESAFIVSLLPAPNIPYDRKSCEQYIRHIRQNKIQDRRLTSVEKCLNYLKRARDKRIQQLLEEGVIKEDVSKKALSTPIRVQLSSKAVPDRKEPLGTAPDFQSFVEDELFEILKKNNLNTDGHYIVETTLDIQSQSDAQDLLDEHIRTDGKAKRYNYGSIVSLDANDSSILVMVDGTSDSSLKGHIYSSGKYSQERMNRRLASTFKLFIYAAALEYGVIGVSRSVADGFAESLNEEASSIASRVGEERVLDLAKKSRIRGAHSNADYETVKQQYQNAEDKSKFIVLGLVESNLLDITNSFAMIANEGKLNHPYSIVRVRDPNKCSESNDLQTCEVIYSREKTMGKASERLLKPKTTEGVWQLLQSVVQYGTAKESVTSNFRLFNVGGKTGTSTDNKDLWFIGTARSQRTWDEDLRISTGVWLGTCALEKNSPYTNPNCDSKGSSSDAVRLWNDYMDSTLN